MLEPVQISCIDAWNMVQDNPGALIIDVRSSMEYLFVGHPTGAIHIPWLDEHEWVVNPHFVQDVRKVLLGGVSSDNEDDSVPMLLICRSGKRSFEAGKKLLEAGLQNVFNIEEGFEGELNEDHQRGKLGGWRFHGLPWEQC
ncbi:rhodanese-like domain-containing protein [Granulosicoccaceae sp. 1_MG-2023]|nr:rhodanese-like domain-containing protein [Granulosicoccaceae sp. 1_MG-2023]